MEYFEQEDRIGATRDRQANAAAGGPLMTPGEWNDEFGI